jgi:hypothetical protein
MRRAAAEICEESNVNAELRRGYREIYTKEVVQEEGKSSMKEFRVSFERR